MSMTYARLTMLQRVAFGWSGSRAFGGRSPAVLGFLGPIAFRCEGPRSWGLDCLGFPWILSSESRLFNGLRGIGGGDFSRALPLAGAAPERSARGLADAEGGTGHGGECNAPSVFPQEIVVAAIRLQPPQPKGNALRFP